MNMNRTPTWHEVVVRVKRDRALAQLRETRSGIDEARFGVDICRPYLYDDPVLALLAGQLHAFLTTIVADSDESTEMFQCHFYEAEHVSGELADRLLEIRSGGNTLQPGVPYTFGVALLETRWREFTATMPADGLFREAMARMARHQLAFREPDLCDPVGLGQTNDAAHLLLLAVQDLFGRRGLPTNFPSVFCRRMRGSPIMWKLDYTIDAPPKGWESESKACMLTRTTFVDEAQLDLALAQRFAQPAEPQLQFGDGVWEAISDYRDELGRRG